MSAGMYYVFKKLETAIRCISYPRTDIVNGNGDDKQDYLWIKNMSGACVIIFHTNFLLFIMNQ